MSSEYSLSRMRRTPGALPGNVFDLNFLSNGRTPLKDSRSVMSVALLSERICLPLGFFIAAILSPILAFSFVF